MNTSDLSYHSDNLSENNYIKTKLVVNFRKKIDEHAADDGIDPYSKIALSKIQEERDLLNS